MMKDMEIRGIIFDLDGTLVHTIEDIAGAANEMFRRHGLPVHEVPYYLQWIGSGAVRFIERAMGEEVDHHHLMDYVAEFKEIYSHNLHDKSRLYDGIAGMLDQVVDQGIKIAVLSNKPHPLTLKVCDFYLSDWPFHPIFGQRDDIPRKPDPAAALEIASIMGMEPGRIMLVGDSDNDMLTAKSAGMIPQGVTWGYGRLEREPVEGMGRLIEEPVELLHVLSLS